MLTATDDKPTTQGAKNVYEAVNAVMSEVGYVQKERKDGGLRYSYASEAALIAALRPSLVKHGLVMFCEAITDVVTREYQSNNGAAMVNVTLTGHWRIVHAHSTTYFVVQSRGEGSDNSDKANNKAMTCSFKYCLRQTFGIETGDDPDKDQQDERATVSTTAAADGGWKPAILDAMIAKGFFKNIFEVRNALRLSKELKPGITPLAGVDFWSIHYRAARDLESLTPEQAAERADSEYAAEKIRKQQDAATG